MSYVFNPPLEFHNPTFKVAQDVYLSSPYLHTEKLLFYTNPRGARNFFHH